MNHTRFLVAALLGMTLSACGQKPPAKYAYVVFEDVPGLSGVALLFQIIRAEWQNDEVLVTGRYRLDLDTRGR